MGVYPAPAVERAMKVQEVILRAMSGEFAWVQAAEILGLSARSMRRWRARDEEHGYTGLYDRRTRRPSPQRVPVATVERVLRLYRERYADFNVRHFHEVLQRDHGVGLSYSVGQEGATNGRVGAPGPQTGPASPPARAAPLAGDGAAHRCQHAPLAGHRASRADPRSSQRE